MGSLFQSEASFKRVWILKILERPTFYIHLGGFLIHAGAALSVLFYNAILRAGLPTTFLTNQEQISRSARIYIGLALLLGFVCRRLAVKCCVKPFLKKRNAPNLEKLLNFPVIQAKISAACWLSTIPVMGLSTWWINGRLNPLTFPHFCISIVLASLIVIAYATTFFQYVIAVLIAGHGLNDEFCRSEKPAAFLQATRVTAWIALFTLFLTTFLFVAFEKPNILDMESYYRLGKLFAFLMAGSGYLWVLCLYTSQETRMLIEPSSQSSASLLNSPPTQTSPFPSPQKVFPHSDQVLLLQEGEDPTDLGTIQQ